MHRSPSMARGESGTSATTEKPPPNRRDLEQVRSHHTGEPTTEQNWSHHTDEHLATHKGEFESEATTKRPGIEATSHSRATQRRSEVTEKQPSAEAEAKQRPPSHHHTAQCRTNPKPPLSNPAQKRSHDKATQCRSGSRDHPHAAEQPSAEAK